MTFKRTLTAMINLPINETWLKFVLNYRPQCSTWFSETDPTVLSNLFLNYRHSVESGSRLQATVSNLVLNHRQKS
jgi:hypothetical protein